MCISPPYVEEPLNSKVIKSFVPELRSRKCFSCFEIPMFHVYIYIYMNILIYVSHITVSGYGTVGTIPKEYVKGLEVLDKRRQVENIQTTALLKSAGILRVLENWGNLRSPKHQWEIISKRYSEKNPRGKWL